MVETHARATSALRREKSKRLRTYFYTTSLEKFAQAALVFNENSLSLQQIAGRDPKPYDEDYSEGKLSLLHRALGQIRQEHGESTLVFIEDTSVRIDAFSTAEDDYPGLAVKEWFASTSFEQVDKELRSLGNDRRATVKSDIALYIPGSSREVLFHGECSGIIADTPPKFDPSSSHPWLTPHTFNGWLIPDNSSKRLGEMTLDESTHFDFRIQALRSLAERLVEYQAILNVPAPQRLYRRLSTSDEGRETTLFTPISRSYAVIGHPCAGKTTFGEYVSSRHLARTFEASTVLREELRFEIDDKTAELSPFDYARTVLDALGKDVVARHIVEELLPAWPDDHAVITGFRTLEEIVTLKNALPDVCVVYIEADARTRFLRQLDDPSRDNMALDEFRTRDINQQLFGLLSVGRDLSDVVIENEYTLDDYYQQIDSALAPSGKPAPGVSTSTHLPMQPANNQLYKCLAALRDAGRPLSTDEIEVGSENYGPRVRHNNANKVLKAVPALAIRHEHGSNRIRYEITGSGLSYLKLAALQYEARAKP